MTTGKTIALTRRTFVGKVMSLLFNMLSRLVITFLPRSKRLLILWLQSPSAVIQLCYPVHGCELSCFSQVQLLSVAYINLPTKIHLVKAMVFPVVMYGCESWTIKEADQQRIDLLNCGVGEDV